VRYCGLGLAERGQRSIRDFEVALSDELAMPDIEANESDQDGRKRQKKDQHDHPPRTQESVRRPTRTK
jgi:hypothetical protein